MEAKIFLLLLIFTMDTVSGVEQEKMPIQYKVLFPYRALKTPVSPQQLNNLTTTVLTNGGEQLFRQIVQHPCCIDKINDPDCIHCNLATGVCCNKISHVQKAFGPEDSPMVQPQGPILNGDPPGRHTVGQKYQPPCCKDKINNPDRRYCIHCNLATGECCDKISHVQQAFGPRDYPLPPCCTGKNHPPGCWICNPWKFGGPISNLPEKKPLPPIRHGTQVPIPNEGEQSFRQIVPPPPCCKASTLPGCRPCSASAPECC